MPLNARAKMKRKLLLAALVLFVATLLCGAALAATDPIVCSMEVSPSTLSEPGEVSVTITVSNSGNTDMQESLTLYNPASEVVTDFGTNGSVTLKAGEVATWTGKWNVNQHTLDNGQIVYFVKYALTGDNGTREVKSQPIRGKLNSTDAKTAIEVKRTISPGTAREGQTVTVRYDIVNNGTVSLKNVTLQENKNISAKKVSVAEELKAGETAQVKLTVTMGKKDLTSGAVVSYTAGDADTALTETVEDQVIHYGEAAMTAKLTSSAKGVEINAKVTLTLELKNNGTVNYTNVRVTDETLGDVFTNQELASGATLKLDKEITLTETTKYLFTITAIDDTGTEVSLNTDELTVTAVDPNKIAHLTLVAAADRTEVYADPGTVRFTLTLTNDSDVDATDVMIYEADTKIYTFATIPAGETRKLTRDAILRMAGKYRFTAVTTDALNNTNKFESNDIQIAFSIPTPAPATPTPAAAPTPVPTYAAVTYVPISNPNVGSVAKLIRTFFYPLLWVSGILLIIAAVLLAIATGKRIKEKRASDAALDHLDRAKRRDYVTPNEEPEEAPAEEPVFAAEEESLSAEEETAPAPDAQPDEEVELPHMKYVRNAYKRSENAKEAEDDRLAHGLHDETPEEAADEAGMTYRRPSGNETDQPAEDEEPEDVPEEMPEDGWEETITESRGPEEDAGSAEAKEPAGTRRTAPRRHRRAEGADREDG